MPKKEITADPINGIFPIEDSIAAYSTKVQFDKNAPQIDVVHNFRIAAIIAIAREDDALNRRRGGLNLIFHHPMTASIQLPEARAGAAVYFDALSQYCQENGLDPKKMLVDNGTAVKDAEMYLEYASKAQSMIAQAIQAQQA